MTCLTMTDDYHDYHKWILKIFEMSILTKILVVTRRDIRLNVDIMKTLDVDHDITDLIRIRPLTYFGHVARMSTETYCIVWTH